MGWKKSLENGLYLNEFLHNIENNNRKRREDCLVIDIKGWRLIRKYENILGILEHSDYEKYLNQNRSSWMKRK